MIGWNFPSNNFGEETGLNDAGIETFRGSPLYSLAREINQNSLDAKLPESDKPVEVHFDLRYLPTERFPDKDSFIAILDSCKHYWQNNAKTKKFFQQALEVMQKPKIPVLKISDYNTTGLTGSDKDRGTDWHNLIKSVGVSDKGSQSGGSFGIGKHAPFACSKIRTVFYSTKDCKGKIAFQGVAKLVTHKNLKGETTQGTGYFGIIDRNQPIREFSNVDKFFQRSNIGTDIFVAGFAAETGWEIKIIKSVLENFFVAIKENCLIVKVGKITINSTSLPDLLDKFIKDDDECLSDKYYNALTSFNSYFFSDDFEGLGRIDLYVLPEKDYPKRVAMVRGTGMKIYDKGHFHTPMKFAGVMLAKGDKLNEFLRSLEPPSHNKWEHERHENPDYARKILKKLNSWINSQVRSISLADDSEELDVEGISQYLPDELDEAPLTSPNEESEGEKTTPKEIEIKPVPRPVAASTATAGTEVAAAAEDNEGTVPTNGENRNNSTGGAPPTIQGETSVHNGEGGTMPDQEGNLLSNTLTTLNLKNVRVFCIDPDSGLYNVSFEPESDGEGFLYLKIVGEVGEGPAPIQTAVVKDTKEKINIEGKGKIGPIKFIAGKKNTLLINLRDSLRCALEVSANAN